MSFTAKVASKTIIRKVGVVLTVEIQKISDEYFEFFPFSQLLIKKFLSKKWTRKTPWTSTNRELPLC